MQTTSTDIPVNAAATNLTDSEQTQHEVKGWMWQIELKLLGPFGLFLEGAKVRLSLRASELLSFLSLQREGCADRHRLAGSLWPYVSDERALSNLNTTIWRLRRSLSPFEPLKFMHVDRHELGLDLALIHVDYREFQDLMNRLNRGVESLDVAARAVALFRGDLLESLPGSDWLLPERERAKLQFLQALRIQAKLQVIEGFVEEGLITYDRLLREDSLNEELYREAMRLHYSLGKRSDALLLYDRLVKRLRDDLNVAPESETEELSGLIRQGHSVEIGLSVDPGRKASHLPQRGIELIGRAAEVNEFTSLLREALVGNTAIIGIKGEAGIGKSRLIIEFARIAHAAGFGILVSTAESIMKPAPYELFRKLLEESLKDHNSTDTTRLLEVFPDRGRPSSGDPRAASEARAQFLEDMARWVRQQAAANPTVLMLEDFHFADSASLDLLTYAVQHTKGCCLIWIITWRPEESHAFPNARLQDLRIFQRVFGLNGLSKSEIDRLCAAFLRTPEQYPPGCSDLVFQESEGNPLFALEILKSITPDELPGDMFEIPPDGNAAVRGRLRSVSGTRLVPERVRLSVRSRFQRLPSVAKRLLRYAAVCGRTLDVDVLGKSMHLPTDTLLRAVDRLVSAGFVDAFDHHIEFHHEKIRMLLYEGLPSSIRAAAHRDVLSMLEEYFPGRLEVLAFHAERAGEKLKSADYWERAGDLATAIWAHGDSANSYSRAIESLEPWTPLIEPRTFRVRLLRKRAASYGLLGEREKETSDLRMALTLATEIGDERLLCELHSMLAWSMVRRERFEQARDEASEADRLARSLSDVRLQATAAEVSAVVLYRSRRYDEAEVEFRALVPSLEEMGDFKSLERVWNLVGRLQIAQGNFRLALLSLDRAEIYDSGNLEERGLRYFARSMALAFVGKAEHAISSAQVSEGYFRRAGDASGQALANCFLAVFHALKGDLASALPLSRKGLPFRCGKTDRRWRDVAMTHLCHSLVLTLGNYGLARRMIAKSLRLAPETEGEGRANVIDLSIITSLEEGDLEGARALVTQVLEGVSRKPTPYQTSFLVTIGRVRLAEGRSKEALTSLQEAAELFEKGEQTTDSVQLFSLLGMAFAEEGYLEEALNHSRKALELHHQFKGFYSYIRPQEVLSNHYSILNRLGDREAPKMLEAAYRIIMRQANQLGKRGKRRFLSIRANRDVIETWEKLLGNGSDGRLDAVDRKSKRGKVAVLIPATGTPRGRPLGSSDHIEVLWTLDAGNQDQSVKKVKGEVGLRRARIMRLCAEANVQGGDPREEDLARVLGVTTRTIRSDIAYLRSQGCHVQTRGSSLH
jgi:DNA-binding SARP family transcriptional activator